MADTNARIKRALDSPLFKLIKETWIDYDSRISFFTVGEEDVLRFTLWCVEGLKDNTGNRKRHTDKLRALLFKQIRQEYVTHCQPEELNLLADVIMAYTMECLEWAQTADWTTFMQLNDEVLDSIDMKDKTSILGYKNTINTKVFEMNLCTEFKEWISDHLTNDVFWTEEDAEWAENITQPKASFKIPIAPTQTRSAGRPKATDKPFGEFVAENIEVSSVVDNIRQSLTDGMGSAPEVGAIIRNLLQADAPSLKKVVPYKVLKKEFGVLIKCTEADYNKQVTTLRK